MSTISIFWFRRDLRYADNVGLYQALNSGFPVLPIFIFDTEILSKLPKEDPRVSFIYFKLQELKKEFEQKHQSSIGMYLGKPKEIFIQLLSQYKVQKVFTNHDYEPYALNRDAEVKDVLQQHGVSFYSYKDQVIFEKNEIVKKDGKPYLVYTPYMHKWKQSIMEDTLKFYESEKLLHKLVKQPNLANLKLSEIGFIKTTTCFPKQQLSESLINNYAKNRNFPARDSTSMLGLYLRFGTHSIRQLVKKAMANKNEVFWNQLIWREFFMQILWHFPHTVNSAFKPKYDQIAWRNNKEEFKRWCTANTGYALVDAGMQQLNQTGFMHNRVRMLVASFLCKHLLIDWRWGADYFAEKLLDYELASNVGNWQWVAGCGVDAAPYFRIFSPAEHLKKFDPDCLYVKKWIPRYSKNNYPKPIVEHKFARQRYLQIVRL